MKNKIFALTALLTLLLCLPLAMTSEAKAELREITCLKCNTTAYIQVLEYIAKREGYDDSQMHWVRMECFNCGYEMVVTTGGKDEHSHNGEKVSCTVGFDKCDVCGKSPVPALGHNWNWEQGTWKRVEGSQQHTRTCHRCKIEEKEDCSGGTATCIKKAVCEKCGEPYGNIDPDAHDLVHHDAKEPTCTEAGWEAYDTCKNCDYVSDHKEFDALGHDCVLSATKASTCTELGWREYRCQHEGCEYHYIVDIPLLAHDLESHDAKAATCTEAGWEAYDTCKNCDYVSDHKEFTALGHDLAHHDAKAATCTEAGWEAYDTCKHCDYVSDHKEFTALGHDLAHHDAKAATCTEAGWEAYDTCKNCDYTTYAEIKPLEHWYSEWMPAANNSHTAICLRGCGHSKAVACETHPLSGELTFCPVCGAVSDGTRLTRIQATAKSAQTLKGELIVRTGTLDSGETIISVAFEIGGKLVKTNREVCVTLPASVLGGGSLCLLNADGTETPLDSTVNDETVTFTLDFAQGETLAMLIRLVPAS